uniref:Ovule protein n=1 Tax=Panagrellus redivivus TaxID=6233 RepID=A0A7E4VXZ6_PANRE
MPTSSFPSQSTHKSEHHRQRRDRSMLTTLPFTELSDPHLINSLCQLVPVLGFTAPCLCSLFVNFEFCFVHCDDGLDSHRFHFHRIAKKCKPKGTSEFNHVTVSLNILIPSLSNQDSTNFA